LNKARVCINGMITRAALVLLGRAEASHLLSPVDARMSWILKSVSGVEKDYEHFFPPFVLATDKLLAKIRNIKVRQMPSGTLFPHEIEQYDQWVLRESLHNCIAHQDYRISGRIVVTETEDAVEFSNQGAFLPGTVESVVTRDAPTERPLNPFLSTAMLNLNMIDTIGSGIKRMFRRQAERAFPLPDYDLATSNRVVVRIEGRVIDERYTQLLLTRTDLDLLDVIALDRVQRRLRLEDEAFRSLKSKGLVEGRRPNLFVSAAVAKATGREVEYVRNRGLAESHYETLVEDLLRQFGPSKRAKIDELLLDRLPDLMDAKQRKRYVANLLQKMKKKGKLSLEGTTRWGLWSISKTRNSQTSS
ncbi:MAG: hypothetical protein KDD44_11195, partial [Bdellovibrionales bacterium]|nr:hypothetical protein [Bdellovibrionales bacterium]